MTSSGALPDSICPICQDIFENVAFLDRCGHKFCYQCVQRWSEIKAECPLCKRPFHYIAHRMGSDFRWKVYTVRPPGADSLDNTNVRRFRNRRRVTAQRRTSQRDPTTRRTASPQDLLRTSTAGPEEPPREDETPGPSSRSDQMRATRAEPSTSTAGAEPWDDATPGPSYARSDQMGATQSNGLDSTESSRDGSANHEANVSQSGQKRKFKRGGKAKTSGNGSFKNSERNGSDDSDDDEDYNLPKRRRS